MPSYTDPSNVKTEHKETGSFTVSDGTSNGSSTVSFSSKYEPETVIGDVDGLFTFDGSDGGHFGVRFTEFVTDSDGYVTGMRFRRINYSGYRLSCNWYVRGVPV